MYEDCKSPSDKELFELLKEGNPNAFDAIYQRYFIPLINTAFKRLHSKEDAQELVQDVFVQLYIKRAQIEHIGNLAAYLHTLLRNKIIDHFRQQIAHKKHHSKLTRMQVSVSQETASGTMDGKLLEEKINAAIDHLPQKCREVFLLSRVGHLSHQNIAKELDISVSTVEKHIIKALKLVRERVEKQHFNSAIFVWLLIRSSIYHLTINQHHIKCMTTLT